jgi:hypothetical protein
MPSDILHKTRHNCNATVKEQRVAKAFWFKSENKSLYVIRDLMQKQRNMEMNKIYFDVEVKSFIEEYLHLELNNGEE